MGFEQYVPYHVNPELLRSLKLEPYAGDEAELANKSAMSVLEALERMAGSIPELELKYDDSGVLRVRMGEQYYSSDESNKKAHSCLEWMLYAANWDTRGLRDVLDCDWYYVDDDERFDFDVRPSFFLCRRGTDRIIRQFISMSSADAIDILLAENLDSLQYESGYRAALARICYEKWQQETHDGRVYAMKARMKGEEEERDLAIIRESRIKREERQRESAEEALLSGLHMLTKHLDYIKALLFAIIGILLYIVLFKLR